MALLEISTEWSDPITLTEKTMFSVNYGSVLVHLGSEEPEDDADGAMLRSGIMAVFDTGTVLRFRQGNENKRVQIYHGPVA